jgi:hypothetical protein
MARMVPSHYPVSDSQTVRVLEDGLDFVINLTPRAAAAKTANLFSALLSDHGHELVDLLGVGRPVAGGDRWIDDSGRGGQLEYIYAEKLTSQLINELTELGLAVAASGQVGARRRSMGRGDCTWIGMDERLAATYMCVLADEVSMSNHLSAVTDQPIAQAAYGGWSIEQVASVLLHTRVEDPQSSATEGNTTAERVAFLAIDLAIPRDIAGVPAEKIVAFRNGHQDELAAFQEAVQAAVHDLRDLPPGIQGPALNNFVRTSVARHLDLPRRELKQALKGMRLDTALSTMTVQSSLPLLGGLSTAGLGIHPFVGVGTGVAVGLATVARSAASRKSNLRKEHPAADYLLELERALGPGKAVRRSLSSLRR